MSMEKRISRRILGRNVGVMIGAAVMLGAVATGCSPEEAKAKGDGKKKTAAGPVGASGMAWNWEQYPAFTRMRVGQLPCQLQPKSTITVMSPISGLLRIYAQSPQSQQKAGFLWGEFEPEILKQDEQMLAESLKKLEDLERVQWEIEYPRKKRQLEQQVKDADRKSTRLNSSH